MSEHTPTPWDVRLCYGITGYPAYEIMGLPRGNRRRDQDNARRIVRCVNAHDKLVAFVRWCALPHMTTFSSAQCERRARALLEEIRMRRIKEIGE